MASYSVADAKNNLPRLLDRALAGEEVTITRRGEVIAEIVAKGAKPSPALDAPQGPNDVAWLRRHRVASGAHDPELDSDSLVRRLRDEGY